MYARVYEILFLSLWFFIELSQYVNEALSCLRDKIPLSGQDSSYGLCGQCCIKYAGNVGNFCYLYTSFALLYICYHLLMVFIICLLKFIYKHCANIWEDCPICRIML